MQLPISGTWTKVLRGNISGGYTAVSILEDGKTKMPGLVISRNRNMRRFEDSNEV